MRILILAAAVAALAAAPAAAATRTVRVDDNYFVRSGGKTPKVTVNKGTVVKWRWYGTRRHNVVVDSGPRTFRSKKKRTGSFERTMRVRGTYRIICEVHEPYMKMRLVVE